MLSQGSSNHVPWGYNQYTVVGRGKDIFIKQDFANFVKQK